MDFQIYRYNDILIVFVFQVRSFFKRDCVLHSYPGALPPDLPSLLFIYDISRFSMS